MRYYILILFIFITYGCGEAFKQPLYRSPSQLAADNSRIDANKCSNFGFKVGTNQYANCMMQQDNNRQKINAQNRKELNKTSKCLMKNSGWSTTPKTLGQILGDC